jgi:hypothetical protein
MIDEWELDDLRKRLESVESGLADLADVPADIARVAEAVQIVRNVLDDLVRWLPDEAERQKYADDLDRLNDLAHLIG